MLLRIICSIIMIVPSLAFANPFGIGGISEPAFTPNSTWLGQILRVLLQWQAQFQADITAQLNLVSISPTAQFLLIFACFAYGIIHSIGPGHGKVVLSAWIMAAQNSQLKQALTFSTISAFTQSLMAILLVAIIFSVLNGTQSIMGQLITSLDVLIGALLIGLGLRLLWRHIPHKHHAHCGCAHHTALEKMHNNRSLFLTAMAAGLRPCTGAILVLTLAFSKGLYVWGILAALAMGFGVALGLIFVGIFVVTSKYFAKKWANAKPSAPRSLIFKSVEIFGAIILLLWGILTLISGVKPYI